MVGDSLDYLQWKTGKRMEGVCFSWNSFVTKFNNAVGAILLSVGLVVFKFVQPVEAGEPLEQSEFTITGLYALVTIIPAISFFLSLVPAALNTYTGSKKAAILRELESRKSVSAAVVSDATVPEQTSQNTVSPVQEKVLQSAETTNSADMAAAVSGNER